MSKILGLGSFTPLLTPHSVGPFIQTKPYKKMFYDTFKAPGNGLVITNNYQQVSITANSWQPVGGMDTPTSGDSGGSGSMNNPGGNVTGAKISVTPFNDYRVETTVVYPAGTPDATRYIGIFCRGDFRVMIRADGLTTEIWEGGTFRSFVINSPLLTPGSPYDMAVTCQGSTITANVEGNIVSYGAAGNSSLCGVYSVPWVGATLSWQFLGVYEL